MGAEELVFDYKQVLKHGIEWIAHVDDTAKPARTLDQILHNAHPDTDVTDPWA